METEENKEGKIEGKKKKVKKLSIERQGLKKRKGNNKQKRRRGE